MAMLSPHDQVLAFVRRHDDQQVLCAFNFSDEAAVWTLPAEVASAAALAGSGLEGARIVDGAIRFEPWGGLHAAC